MKAIFGKVNIVMNRENILGAILHKIDEFCAKCLRFACQPTHCFLRARSHQPQEQRYQQWKAPMFALPMQTTVVERRFA